MSAWVVVRPVSCVVVRLLTWVALSALTSVEVRLLTWVVVSAATWAPVRPPTCGFVEQVARLGCRQVGNLAGGQVGHLGRAETRQLGRAQGRRIGGGDRVKLRVRPGRRAGVEGRSCRPGSWRSGPSPSCTVVSPALPACRSGSAVGSRSGCSGRVVFTAPTWVAVSPEELGGRQVAGLGRGQIAHLSSAVKVPACVELRPESCVVLRLAQGRVLATASSCTAESALSWVEVRVVEAAVVVRAADLGRRRDPCQPGWSRGSAARWT